MIFITGIMRSGTTAIQTIFSEYVECERFPEVLKISGDIQRGGECPDLNFLNSDKSYAYYNFSDELYKQLGAKILYVVRDGKSVVRSIMDWDTRWEKKEYKKTLNYYARINKYKDPFKNAIYYYKKYNQMGLKALSKIPDSHKYILNMDTVTQDEIVRIFDYFGLKSPDKKTIKNMLEGKINSRKSRFGIEDDFPQPENWTKGMNEIYDSVIFGTD